MTFLKSNDLLNWVCNSFPQANLIKQPNSPSIS